MQKSKYKVRFSIQRISEISEKHFMAIWDGPSGPVCFKTQNKRTKMLLATPFCKYCHKKGEYFGLLIEKSPKFKNLKVNDKNQECILAELHLFCQDGSYLTLDHITPICRGGGRENNLQILCRKCNGTKGGDLPEEFEERMGLL